MGEFDQAHEKHKPKGGLRKWIRRALAVAVIAAGVGTAAYIESQTTPQGPENLAADKITTVDWGADLSLPLDDNDHYNLQVYDGFNERDGIQTHFERVHGNQIIKIENQDVPQGAGVVDIKSPGANDETEIPLVVTVKEADGTTERGVLTIYALSKNVSTGGNIRVVNGEAKRDGNGQWYETGSNKPFDVVSFPKE